MPIAPGGDHEPARRVEIGARDGERARDLLTQRGPLSAGQLADLTGLTTGAVTGIIDRLERAGWVRRERDPADRRRLIVSLALTGEQLRRVQRVFQPIARAVDGALDRYSDAELGTLLDFLERTRGLVELEVERMRADPAPRRP